METGKASRERDGHDNRVSYEKSRQIERKSLCKGVETIQCEDLMAASKTLIDSEHLQVPEFIDRSYRYGYIGFMNI